MQVMPMLRRKLSTTVRSRLALPEHYKGNLVDQDVKMADPVWLKDIDPAELLVFVHVPKAAGTSLNSVLWQVYGRGYVNYHPTLSPPSVRKQVERRPNRVLALGAHRPYGFHESFVRASLWGKPKNAFAKRRCRYVTVLRNPIDRMKSYYRFVTTFPAHRLHRATKGMSPDAFFRHMREIGNAECANLQCHMVARTQDFEAARDHLVGGYHAVGVVERMDDFIDHLRTSLNWPDVFEAKRRNASPAHVHDDDFSRDALAWISESNEADMKLYEFARDHLAPGGRAAEAEVGGMENRHV